MLGISWGPQARWPCNLIAWCDPNLALDHYCSSRLAPMTHTGDPVKLSVRGSEAAVGEALYKNWTTVSVFNLHLA
jgi:hypothetical protein